MAQLVKGLSVVAVHDAGTDFYNAHDTDPNEISATTVNDAVTAARPVQTIADLGTNADDTTLTTAQVKGGIITCDMQASKTVTFPTGANCIADLDLGENGATIDVLFVNTDASNAFTVAVGASNFDAIIGTAAVAAGGSATFRVRRKNSSTCQLICVFHT